MLHTKSDKSSGASLIEVILAIAIFSLVATAVIGLISNVFLTQAQAGQQTLAQIYAEEGMEAVRSIRRQAWNLLENGNHGIADTSGEWQFSGTSATIGDYTRTITVADACRDGLGDIVDCPGTSDIHTKKVTSEVSWTAIAGFTNDVTLVSYLTNWQSKDWIQSDWSGGPGQAVWSDPSRYWTDDGNIDFSSAGVIRLAGSVGGGPVSREWPFDTPANYSYDTDKIEVISSFGQLKLQSGIASGQTLNAGFDNFTSDSYDWTFTNPADYSYDPAKIEVVSDVAQLIASTSIGSVIDTLEFDLSQGSDPDIIHIANNIYAIAYRGPGSDGFVKTVQIDSNGIMLPITIDSLEYDTANGYTPSIINVAGNIYAIAYRGTGADGFIRTVEIDVLGNITNSIIDSLEYDTGNGYFPDLIQISSDIFAIAYQGNGTDGFIRTIQIDSAGNITDSVVDSYEYNNRRGSEPDIINISGDIYAVAHRGAGSDGFISTVSIDSAGNIGTVIDTLEFDTADGYEPDIINVFGDVYVVAYRGTGSDGFAVTMTIDSLGNVGDTVIDTIEFDQIYGGMPDIVNITGDNYALVYRGPNDDGFVSILNIQIDGQIADSVVDTFEFDAGTGIYPKIINVGINIFAVAYQGPATDGFIKTIEILAGYDTGLPTINSNSSYVSPGITTWSSFIETATKNGGEIYYQLSDGATWYWWDGGVWTVAGASDYNTAIEVNTNISSFSVVSEQIMFRAFMESDGTQQVQLDNIEIGSVIFEGWSYYDWDWQTGEVDPSGNIQTTGGNPGNWVDIYFPRGSGDSVGGFWQQEFITTVDNPDNVAVAFDGAVFQFPDIPTNLIAYVFVDNAPGEPTLGTQVWSSVPISGTIPWTNFNIDATSAVSNAGTYYLKLAVGLQQGSFNRGPYQMGFDNAQLSWSKGLSGYSDNSPTIQPISSFQPTEVTSWTAFSEVANKNGGEIYYQLSDDDGTTWYWWDGDSWERDVAIPGGLSMEVGQVSVGDTWQLVNTQVSYANPVVIASFVMSSNILPVSVRVRNVMPDSFEIRLENPSGSTLSSDIVNYMVIEEGTWTVGGTTIEAHRYNTATVGSSSGWNADSMSYDNVYGTDPIVLHQLMSDNDPAWITTWVSQNGSQTNPPNTSGFQMALNCAETCTSHGASETIGWVAIQMSVTDTVNGVDFETQRTADNVTGYPNCINTSLLQSYSVAPIVLSSMLEMDGGNGGWNVICNQATSQAGFHSEEDQVGDSERSHTGETHGFLAFANGFFIDGGGGGASTTNYNTADIINTNISEFPVDNLKILFKVFLVGDGTQQVQLDTVTIEGENISLSMEVGQVTTDHQWTTVNTLNTYTNPVVVANFYEAANTLSASVRIANVSNSSFQIKLQNPTDSLLNPDVISYMVIEEGTWDIGSAVIEAHRYDTSTLAYRGNWIGDSQTYDNTFSVSPIILHQIMSNNDPDWVTTWVSRTGVRSSPPDTSGFQIAMNCAEACTSHATLETIGWVAIEINVTDVVEGVVFETQRTSDSVRGHDNGCYTFNFNNSFAGMPVVIPAQLEMDGNDGAWGLMCNLASTFVGLHAEEDQVGDSERAHTTETFGFLVFANSFRVEGGGGGSGYATYGEFESSAFDTGNISSFNLISWIEILPTLSENIRIQVATAPDAGGTPGVWSAWTGITGAVTYYDDPIETLIPSISGHNDDQWVKYRVELTGGGTDTPTLDEITINYTP